jgi:c-di-GMP-binding flagellar brake protein YcgR
VKIESTQFEDLLLMPGQSLLVQLQSYGSFRDKAKYIGSKRPGSIIITTPIANGASVPAHVGQSLTVKFFSNQTNSACAFVTEIIHVSKNPYPHLHLSFPTDIEIGEIRKAIRAKVKIAGKLIFKYSPVEDKSKENSNDKNSKKSEYDCQILDVSANGAKVEAASPIGKTGVTLKLEMELSVQEIVRSMNLSCEIKSLTQDERSGNFFVGLQFVDVNENDRLMLYAFVYAHLMDG